MIKESKEFLNLPVITTEEGNEIATTVNFLINANEKKVVAITVKDSEYYKALKLIPVKQIIGVGKDALIINKPNNIIPYTNIASAENLLQDGISIIGTTVINNNGEVKGTVSEYCLDEQYNIVKLIIHNNDEVYDIPIDKVNVLAKEHTVINDNLLNDVKEEKVIPKDWFSEYKLILEGEPKLTNTLRIKDKTYSSGTKLNEQILKEICDTGDEKILNDLYNYIE